jgi:transcription elongation GreA/GreB family factor
VLADQMQKLSNHPLHQTASHSQRQFTLRREDGREQTFTIVGEDEADPSSGTISYVSPLARAAMGRALGDSIDLTGQTAVILNIISS